MWDAARTATYAKVGGALAASVRALEPAKAAVRALSDTVRPGYWFTTEPMASLFGVSERESALQSSKTVMKPYWIKTEHVSWLDVQYLGHKADEVGKVVIGPPIGKEEPISGLEAQWIGKDSPVRQEGLDRLNHAHGGDQGRVPRDAEVGEDLRGQREVAVGPAASTPRIGHLGPEGRVLVGGERELPHQLGECSRAGAGGSAPILAH